MKSTENARKLKRIAKEKEKKAMNTAWKSKPLHGQYPLRIQNADVDLHDTHQWLRSPGIKADTKGFIVAAEDQSLFPGNFQTNIFHNGANPRCNICNMNTEDTDHLIPGCTTLGPNEYRNRHNRVRQYLHWKTCNYYDIRTLDKWYEYKPLPVVNTLKVTILWDFPIRTDRTIQLNRPGIVIKHNQNKTCQFIHMSIPSDSNISAKEFEKLSKYKDLKIEIAKMWKMKTKTIPVIVGTLRMTKKGIQKYVNEVPQNLFVVEIQKIVLNSIAHILRRTISL